MSQTDRRNPLTIWTNASLPEPQMAELARRIAPHRLIASTAKPATNLVAGGLDPALNDAHVAFGQPDPNQAIDAARLRWVHLTSAGYTRYDTPEFRQAFTNRGAILTNSSGVYDEPCAEHMLAMMLANARQLAGAFENQRGDRGWPHLPLRRKSALLAGQSAVIYGFGAIAERLCELLAPFKMQLIGVRRTPKPNALAKVIGIDNADAVLGDADHVVNILPDNPTTAGYFNADRFAKVKPGAAFYNIGRGTTVDQVALERALTQNHLSAAWLDVTDPEPLPPESPLWHAPNCHITPHTAGGHMTEFDRLVAHFVGNLARFVAGEEMEDRVV